MGEPPSENGSAHDSSTWLALQSSATGAPGASGTTATKNNRLKWLLKKINQINLLRHFYGTADSVALIDVQVRSNQNWAIIFITWLELSNTKILSIGISRITASLFFQLLANKKKKSFFSIYILDLSFYHEILKMSLLSFNILFMYLFLANTF
jgi:hypothetical protein